MNKNILIVDDEKNILRALNRVFLESNYHIFLAESGEEALGILEKQPIDLIITDMKMPNIDGYNLLKQVREKYPNLLKIILSGYAERELILKSISENIALFYLLKPWNNERLINRVANLFQLEEKLKEKNILEIVSSPSVNRMIEKEVYDDLYKKIKNNAQLKEIEGVIQQSPEFVFFILGFINNAFDSIEVGSISKALNYVTLIDLENIIIHSEVCCVDDNLKKGKKIIRQHAVLTNVIVNFIYEKILNRKIIQCYSCVGFAHNVGKITMLNVYKEKYIELLNKTSNDMDLYKAEQEIFGVTSQEMSGYLLSWWGLPNPMVECVAFYRDPLNEEVINKEILCILHIAICYAWRSLGYNDYFDLNIDTFEFLNIEKSDFEREIYLYLNQK